MSASVAQRDTLRPYPPPRVTPSSDRIVARRLRHDLLLPKRAPGLPGDVSGGCFILCLCVARNQVALGSDTLHRSGCVLVGASTRAHALFRWHFAYPFPRTSGDTRDRVALVWKPDRSGSADRFLQEPRSIRWVPGF